MKLTLIALCAVQLSTAADSALDILPANTKAVLGIRVPALAHSAIFKDAGPGAQKFSDEWLKLVAVTGFDPLRDVDEVLIASPADNEKADALMVLRGRFDMARPDAGSTRYHGVAIMGSSKGLLAFLDAETAVAGDASAVHAAIDRRGQKSTLDPGLAARLLSLRERFDLWGAGERPDGFVPPTGRNEGLNSMDRFEFGIRLSKGFELTAEIHARSPQDAQKLAGSVAILQSMTQGTKQDGTKFDVAVSNGTVTVSLAISDEELKKAISAQLLAPPPAGGPPVIVGSESAAPAPQGRTDGTRVFVLIPNIYVCNFRELVAL